MITNLNDISATNLVRRYNNTNNINIYFSDEIGQTRTFTKDSVVNGILTVNDINIKNCVIVTPTSQVWNALDYYHVGDDTKFNFSFLSNQDWESGIYTIYIGNSEQGSFLQTPSISNSSQHQIVQKNNNIYNFKKISSDNTINIQQSENEDCLIFSVAQNVSTTPTELPTKIDCIEYSTQMHYVLVDAQIEDIINGNIVTLLLYKPNQTLLTYHNQVILNPYDIGWFTFVIKKISNKLFISQPTKIITDFTINFQ